MSSNLYKSTGGFDANNQRIANLADPSAQGDAVNLKVFDQKNTVQPYLTNRPYDVDFVVEYNYQLWKCIASTSGAFDKTKWRVINGPENWIRITNTYTAANGDALLVDTTSAAITVTLPASPKSGDYINITDAGSAATNAITIARNGSTIGGVASNISVTEPNTQLRLVYLNGTWQLNIVRPDRVRFVTGAVTVEPNIEHMVDAASSFTITLPNNPKTGDWVGMTDRAGAFGTYPITVSGNSKQIAGASTFVMNQKKASVQFMYNGSQWVVYNRTGNALLAHNNLSELEDPAAARTALQLDTMATKKAGTGATEFRNNSENDGAYQPKDATLTALAALTTALNKLVYATGPDQFALTDFTAQARTFLAAATQAAQRSSMGLGSAATMNMGNSLGELMQVGAFGLGSFTQVTNGPDLVTVTGLYTVPSTAPNAPIDTINSVMLHYEIAGAIESGAVQLAIDTNTVIYTRVRTGASTWGAWASIAPASSLGTAAYQDIGENTGDVMQVGAFGLGGTGTSVIADIDDSTLKAGVYTVNTSTIGTKPIAIAEGIVNNGILIVGRLNTGNTVQLLVNGTGKYTFTRSSNAGVWSAWTESYTPLNTGTAATKNVGVATGNVMEVGAFGLGADVSTSVVTDCNTATKNGWFVVSDTATNRPSNIGANLAGLFVIADGVSTRRTQIFTNATVGNTPAMWIRQFNGSVWTAWVEFAEDRVGEIVVSASATAMPGTLKANGAAVSRTAYARLFAKIGTTFGAGDGSTTFNLPDLRGEFIRGWDDGRGVDSGRVFGSSQGDAIRNITGTGGSTVAYGYSGAFYAGTARPAVGTGGSSLNDAMFDASRVVPTASENRPRNVAMLYCIRY